MRGRFNDPQAVYDGGMRILEHGIFEHLAKESDELKLTAADFLPDNQDQNKESRINVLQRRRSQVYKEELESKRNAPTRKSLLSRVTGAGSETQNSLSKPLLG
jgi:hypothetical protein